MTHQESWATLSTFSFVSDAQVLRTFLESEGIETLIPEEHTASLTPVFTAMQVRVQVRTRDLDRARELIRELDLAGAGSLVPESAPADSSPRRSFWSRWFRFVIGLFVGAPMREGSRRTRDRGSR